MMKKHKMLICAATLLVLSAISPARVLIRFFAFYCFFVGLLSILLRTDYKRVLPVGVLCSSIVFWAVRVLMAIVKQETEIAILARDALGEALFIFIPLAVLLSMVAYFDFTTWRKYVIWVVVLMIPFLLQTIRADVGSSRLLMIVSERVSVEAMIKTYEVNRSGVMMYSTIHAMPFVLAALVLIFKRLKIIREKIFTGMIAMLVMLAIVRSGFGYAIAMSLGLACLALVGSRHLAMVIVGIVAVFLMLLVLIKTGAMISILEFVQNGFGYDNVIGVKAGEIANIIRGETADDFETRKIMYTLSWEAFCRFPLFGNDGSMTLGGHAYWLDALGHWGIVGVFSEVLMFIVAFTTAYKILPHNQKYVFAIILAAYVFICSVKANAFDAQNPVIYLIVIPIMLFRKDDFYAASDNVRRLFHIPPRMAYP